MEIHWDARASLPQYSAGAATRNGEQIELDIQGWLINMNRKIGNEDAEEMSEDRHEAKRRDFIDLCPDFMSAGAEIKAIAEPLARASRLTRYEVSYWPDLQRMVSTSAQASDSFQFRESVVDGILKALKYLNVQSIEIFGTGGVGKIRQLKEVAKNMRG